MTPEQLETAARRLCEIRGKDPDKIEGEEGWSEADVYYQCPAWKNAAAELEKHVQRDQAIDFALLEGRL